MIRKISNYPFIFVHPSGICFFEKYVPTVTEIPEGHYGQTATAFLFQPVSKTSIWVNHKSVLVVVVYAERQFVRQGTHNWICTQADASRTTKAFSPSPGTGDWWWATMFLCKPNRTIIHTILCKMRWMQDEILFYSPGNGSSISHLLVKGKLSTKKCVVKGYPQFPGGVSCTNKTLCADSPSKQF